MDASTNKIIREVSEEMGLDPGFLARVLELEEERAHLARRHGLFEDLDEVSRKSAMRHLTGDRKDP